MNESPVHGLTQQVKEKKSSKALKIIFVIVFLIAAASTSYSIYAWQQNRDLTYKTNKQSNTIRNLNTQITSVNQNETPATDSVIPIRELGVSITVPDSIKDLTYSYTPILNENGKFEAVQFSTKSITDQYATSDHTTNECTSYGNAAPLGALSKESGVYDTKNPHVSVLVKQFANYYILYSPPNAVCTTQQPLGQDLSKGISRNYFFKALSTVKEL